jgi:hypothetical protein
MSLELIGVFTVIIGWISLIRGPDFGVKFFVPLTLLGAAAAILLGGSGTIQPAHLMLGFFVLSCVLSRFPVTSIVATLTFPNEGFWLATLAAYGVTGAYLLPRLFSGMTGVNAIGITESGPAVVLVPLGPTSGNVTQSIYLFADVICFLAILSYASSANGFWRVTHALLVFSTLNILFAAIDFLTGVTDTGYLLDIIRNANYQLHVEEVTGGLRRIVGSFTETSAFSYATIGSLAFTGQLWLLGYRANLTGSLSLVSLVLLALSTSTTAYVATPIVGLILYFIAAVRIFSRRASATSFVYIAIAPLAVLFFIITVLLIPQASLAFYDFFEVALLAKSSSQSGLERAEWNRNAFQNFIDTYGLGGGLGSIRASSFILAVASNMGVIGLLCFLMFFLNILKTDVYSSRHLSADIRSAAKMACVAIIVAGCISGALVDLGLTFYVFAALACTNYNGNDHNVERA